MWLRMQRFCNIMMDWVLTIFYSCLKNWSCNYQVHFGTSSVEHLFLSHYWLINAGFGCPLLLAAEVLWAHKLLGSSTTRLWNCNLCQCNLHHEEKQFHQKFSWQQDDVSLWGKEILWLWNGETWLILIYKVSQSSNEEEFCPNVNMVATWDQGVWCGGFVQEGV